MDTAYIDQPETDVHRAHRAWSHAERVKRLSDRVIGVGPIGIGMDGLLAWIPGANVLYSVAAAGILVFDAVQSKASTKTLVRMGIYLAADSALSGIPVAGWAVDTFFPGHLMAAKALQRDIEGRHGRPVTAPLKSARPRRWSQLWRRSGASG